jgi:protein phosphatase 2C family protein 2/3
MFGIFDGHGGSACAEYLRDNLHLLLIHQNYFPKNPGLALKNAIL